MTRSLALAAVLALLAAAPPARADGPVTFDVHMAKARDLHAKGDFDGARAEILAAYQLDPRPELLFALGQLEFNLHHYQAAIDYYERFTATKPNAEQAAIAEQAIGAAKAELSHAPEPPPQPTTPEPAQPVQPAQPAQPVPNAAPPRPTAPPTTPTAALPLPSLPSPHTWDRLDTGLAIAGGAAILAGGAMAIEAVHLSHDGAGTLADYDRRVLTARRLRIASAITGAAGVVALGASILRFAIHRDTAVEVQASPSGAAVTLEHPL